MSLDLWEELNKISDTPIEYDNDTDLDLEILLSLDWQLQSTERSGYSTVWADTYVEPTGKYAKKVFNDGFVEFYELA
jgi:hypothetical protein